MEIIETRCASNVGVRTAKSLRATKIDRLKMFAESLGLNPDEVLSQDILARPHRTIVDAEQNQINVLNAALKEEILQKLRTALPESVALSH